MCILERLWCPPGCVNMCFCVRCVDKAIYKCLARKGEEGTPQ